LKPSALLADLLINANAVVSVDQLVDDLWGETPPSDPSHALQVLVSQLRRRAGLADLLITQASGYLLTVDLDRLDCHRFESIFEEGRTAQIQGDAARASSLLTEALGLWRGRALSDFAYEPFAQPAISRLEELRLAAAQERNEVELALGRHVELVGQLEEAVQMHPLAERLRAQLMVALYRSGRQADALRVYQETRQALVGSLGLEPSPALQDLERQILHHDPRLASSPSAGQRQAADPAAAARSILVVARDAVGLDPLLELAVPLAQSDLSRELVVTVLADPDGDGLDRAFRLANSRQAELESQRAQVRVAAFTTTEPAADTIRLSAEHGVDLLLIPGGSDLDPQLDEILKGVPCDVCVTVPREPLGEGAIAAAFGGAEHDWAALEIAAWLASALGRELRLCGPAAEPDEGRRDSSRLLAHASIVVQRFVGISAQPVLTEPGSKGLLDAARSAALLVVGLSERWREEGLGTVRRRLAEASESSVIFVRRGSGGALTPAEGITRFRWSLTAPSDSS
jgi:DNA-binding SARP family transcriptional activator